MCMSILDIFKISNYDNLKKNNKEYLNQLLIRHRLLQQLKFNFGFIFGRLSPTLKNIFTEIILNDPELNFGNRIFRQAIRKRIINNSQKKDLKEYLQVLRQTFNTGFQNNRQKKTEKTSVEIMNEEVQEIKNNANNISVSIDLSYPLDKIIVDMRELLKNYNAKYRVEQRNKNDGLLSLAELDNMKSSEFLAYVDLMLIKQMNNLFLTQSQIREFLFGQYEKTEMDINRNSTKVKQELPRKYKKFTEPQYEKKLEFSLKNGLKKSQIRQKKKALHNKRD